MKTISVRVPDKLTLEQSQKVLASVLGKMGHPACYSGFNINFQNAVDPALAVLRVDANLHVSEV
ncbi:MAG TPA: hypothetical protein VHZ74_17115 [Bryobacteraceae bacterium]|jgi:hypothetical protein|nr:hypothetical protein [Bryobacteraceae bacterium]